MRARRGALSGRLRPSTSPLPGEVARKHPDSGDADPARLALSGRERSEPKSLPQAVLGEGPARSARERAREGRESRRCFCVGEFDRFVDDKPESGGSMGLKVGDRAPEVTLPSHDNQQTPLSSLWKDGPAALLFFPLAFTSTCTAEMCTVRDDIGSYTGVNGTVAAISVDSPFVLNKFREELGADYLFLSDFNREASRGFGVLRAEPI